MEQNKKIAVLHEWIKELSWKENNERTDAELKVVVVPNSCDDSPTDYDSNAILDCSKKDYIRFIELLCEERIDVYSISSMTITLDGNASDTEVVIEADIHLAE